MQPDPVVVAGGVLVTLSAFVLIGYIVHSQQAAPARRIATVLTAVAAVLAALPALLYALYGG
jgi:hypothetical protein